MRHLQNIMDIYQFTRMSEGKEDSYSSLPFWDDCISDVKVSIFSDKTTTKDNLRDKAKNYALNYIALQPEASFIDREVVAEKIADEVEAALKDAHFDQRPPASVIAQKTREQIPEDPENRFIKLSL